MVRSGKSEGRQTTKSSQSPDRLAATLVLDERVERVRLVSPTRSRALGDIGIFTVRDLITHFPRRYIDMSDVQTITKASIGKMCTILGTIHEIELKRPKPYLPLVEIGLTDETGVMMVTCFRQPWLMDTLNAGMRIAVSGKMEFDYGFKRFTNPFIEAIENDQNEKGGMIVPVHSATLSISSAWMRRLIGNALDLSRGILDPLPLALRTRYRLQSRQIAFRSIHFPVEVSEIDEARRRLVYEELLLLELHLKTESAQRVCGKSATAHVVDGACLKKLKAELPFELSLEQLVAVDDILERMAQSSVSNHILLGDVGTGKTIVAAFALAACADTGGQAFMMAPTEVLARQYGIKLGDIFDKVGIRWGLLTSSTSSTEKNMLLESFFLGNIDVLFGTHALLEDKVVARKCTLVIIDEQHRFGVKQRDKLLEKGEAPDALYLSATPIPRSLALALYGDHTLSYIRSRPHNVAGNITKVLTKKERGVAYDGALEALGKGHQVFVVCPLIGDGKNEEQNQPSKRPASEFESIEYDYASVSVESEADFERDNLSAAKNEARFLQNKTFSAYKVALLHGKMKSSEKQQVMEGFYNGDVHVLVATTVIEVGIDVPNATVIIIEDADRFGLAQLHQLRGRVGRGDEPGKVFLVSSSKAPKALERLAAMEKTEDGLELATFDLSLRREGDILGNKQHGASMLKLVNVVRDARVIEAAHADAEAILAIDPLLESAEYRGLGREMRTVFSEQHTRRDT